MVCSNLAMKWAAFSNSPFWSSPKDENSYYENTTWCNRDLIPIPPDRRTFGVWSYFGEEI